MGFVFPFSARLARFSECTQIPISSSDHNDLVAQVFHVLFSCTDSAMGQTSSLQQQLLLLDHVHPEVHISLGSLATLMQAVWPVAPSHKSESKALNLQTLLPAGVYPSWLGHARGWH